MAQDAQASRPQLFLDPEKKKGPPPSVAPKVLEAPCLCLAFGFFQLMRQLVLPAATWHGERRRFIKDSSLRVNLSPNPGCFV